MNKKLAIHILRRDLPKGSAVMTITEKHGKEEHKVRVFSVLPWYSDPVSYNIFEITAAVKMALQNCPDKCYADQPFLVIDGGGFNIGFDVVCTISRLLYNETYALRHNDY